MHLIILDYLQSNQTVLNELTTMRSQVHEFAVGCAYDSSPAFNHVICKHPLRSFILTRVACMMIIKLSRMYFKYIRLYVSTFIACIWCCGGQECENLLKILLHLQSRIPAGVQQYQLSRWMYNGTTTYHRGCTYTTYHRWCPWKVNLVGGDITVAFAFLMYLISKAFSPKPNSFIKYMCT